MIALSSGCGLNLSVSYPLENLIKRRKLEFASSFERLESLPPLAIAEIGPEGGTIEVGDASGAIIFSDRVLVDAPLAPWDGSVKIGGNDRLGRYFNGSLDEMRVFNQALSLDQIQSYIDK